MNPNLSGTVASVDHGQALIMIMVDSYYKDGGALVWLNPNLRGTVASVDHHENGGMINEHDD